MDRSQSQEWKERRVGAIWERETKKGEPKLSIKFAEDNFFALKNTAKLGNQPDWIIFR